MILGIDPGLSGALALYHSARLSIIDIPTTERKVNNKLKRQVDLRQLAVWLDMQKPYIEFAIIEQVSAMPGRAVPGGAARGMGATSAFNFGFTTGAIHGILAGLGIPYRTVVPVVWKRYFGLLGQGKDASRAEASRRLPQHAHHWPLKKHDGRAEATLLALYGVLNRA